MSQICFVPKLAKGQETSEDSATFPNFTVFKFGHSPLAILAFLKTLSLTQVFIFLFDA